MYETSASWLSTPASCVGGGVAALTFVVMSLTITARAGYGAFGCRAAVYGAITAYGPFYEVNLTPKVQATDTAANK